LKTNQVRLHEAILDEEAVLQHLLGIATIDLPELGDLKYSPE
jgi:hypothetical protein